MYTRISRVAAAAAADVSENEPDFSSLLIVDKEDVSARGENSNNNNNNTNIERTNERTNEREQKKKRSLWQPITFFLSSLFRFMVWITHKHTCTRMHRGAHSLTFIAFIYSCFGISISHTWWRTHDKHKHAFAQPPPLPLPPSAVAVAVACSNTQFYGKLLQDNPNAIA